jgi:hypothetical protein
MRRDPFLSPRYGLALDQAHATAIIAVDKPLARADLPFRRSFVCFVFLFFVFLPLFRRSSCTSSVPAYSPNPTPTLQSRWAGTGHIASSLPRQRTARLGARWRRTGQSVRVQCVFSAYRHTHAMGDGEFILSHCGACNTHFLGLRVMTSRRLSALCPSIFPLFLSAVCASLLALLEGSLGALASLRLSAADCSPHRRLEAYRALPGNNSLIMSNY